MITILAMMILAKTPVLANDIAIKFWEPKGEEYTTIGEMEHDRTPPKSTIYLPPGAVRITTVVNFKKGDKREYEGPVRGICFWSKQDKPLGCMTGWAIVDTSVPGEWVKPERVAKP